MSENYISGDVAARLLKVTPKELEKLVKEGVIQRLGPNKYVLAVVVQGYIDHLNHKIENKDKLNQVQLAKHLDISERRLRDVLRELQLDHRTVSADEIRWAYIRDLREKAAGRNDEDLGEARRQDTLASAHLKMLDIFDKHRKVIWAPHLIPILDGLMEAIQSNVMTAATKIISALESQHDIEIDDELITSSLRAALRNVEGSGKELIASVFGESEEAGP